MPKVSADHGCQQQLERVRKGGDVDNNGSASVPPAFLTCTEPAPCSPSLLTVHLLPVHLLPVHLLTVHLLPVHWLPVHLLTVQMTTGWGTSAADAS